MNFPIKALTSGRALLLVFCGAICALLASSFWLLHDLREGDLRQARMQLDGLSKIMGTQTTSALDGVELALRSAQERLSDPLGQRIALNSLPVKLLLEARTAGLPQIRSLFVLDQVGLLENSSLIEVTGRPSYADRSYFRFFASGGRSPYFMSEPIRNRIDGEWSVFLSAALVDEQKQFRGVVVASISLQYFSALYAEVGQHMVEQIELFDDRGLLVARYPHRQDLLGMPMSGLRNGAETPIGKGLTEHSGYQGVTGLSKEERIGEHPLTIRLFRSQSQVLVPWTRIALSVSSGVVLIIALIALAATNLLGSLRRHEILTEQIAEREQHLRLLLASVHDAIVTVDEQLGIVLFNRAAEDLFGITASDLSDTSFAHFLSDGSVRLLGDWLSRPDSDWRETSHFSLHEMSGLNAEGRSLLLEATWSSMNVRGVRFVTLVFREISQRRKAEQALLESNRQLKELTGSLQLVRESERRHIARELHDELGQFLTGIRFDLGWLDRHCPKDRPDLKGKLASTFSQLDITIASVRRITTELHPLILDDLGLGSALRNLVDRFVEQSGTEVSLSLPNEDPLRSGPVSVALYRIIQESLTNIGKYASATRVNVRLDHNADHWALSVRDNGIGFECDSLQYGGLGLIGMRERATLLGGGFEVTSSVKTGTCVSVWIPVEASEEVE